MQVFKQELTEMLQERAEQLQTLLDSTKMVKSDCVYVSRDRVEAITELLNVAAYEIGGSVD